MLSIEPVPSVGPLGAQWQTIAAVGHMSGHTHSAPTIQLGSCSRAECTIAVTSSSLCHICVTESSSCTAPCVLSVTHTASYYYIASAMVVLAFSLSCHLHNFCF